MKPVLSAALALLVAGSTLPAQAQQYDWHTSARLGGVYRQYMGVTLPSVTAKTAVSTAGGGIVVGGAYRGPLTVESPTLTLPSNASGEATDGFVSAYSATGARQWSRSFVGTDPIYESAVQQVGVDSAGVVYVSGSYGGSLAIPPDPNTFNGYGSYIGRFNGTTGSLLSLRRVFIGTERLRGMCVDKFGLTYIAGVVNGGTQQLVGYPVQPTPGQTVTPFIAQQDPVSGIVPWAYPIQAAANSAVDITGMTLVGNNNEGVLVYGTFRGSINYNTQALNSYDQNNQPLTTGFVLYLDAATGIFNGFRKITPLTKVLTAGRRIFVVAQPTETFLFNNTTVRVTPGTGLSEQDIFIGELNYSNINFGTVLFSGGGPGRQSLLDAAINPATSSIALQMYYINTPQIGSLTFEPATSSYTAFALVQFAPNGTPQRVLRVPSPVSAFAFESTRVVVDSADNPTLVIPVNAAGSQFGSMPRVDPIYPGGTTLAVVKAGLILATRGEGAPAEFSLYPNPAREMTTVAITGWAGATLQVFDALGRCSWQGKLNQTGQTAMPVASMAPGIYVVRAVAADGRYASRRLTIVP